MIYDVRHKTTFTYEDVVSVSHHVLHLTPRPHPRQTCLDSAMIVDPSPAVDSSGEDYFGNPVHYLTVQEPHERLVVDARARIEVRPAASPIDLNGQRAVGADPRAARAPKPRSTPTSSRSTRRTS